MAARIDRNNVVDNFPIEERERARQFGTFTYDPYRSPPLRDDVPRLSGRSMADMLRHENSAFASLNIDFGALSA